MYIFSTEDIDFGSKTVKGLYFNPKMINESDAWKEGIFPLSNAIYRRVGLSTKEMSKLRQFTNNGLFNSRYFDKLEFWNLVHDKNLVNEHVPKTKFISSLNEVEDMFLEFNSLYLKPTDDSMAGGLIKVEKIKDCYYTKKPFDDNSAIFKSKDELNKFIQDIISTRKYLVQQSIKSLQIDNRPADFRVIMQKDNTLKWRCTGIICRIGKENGICSNFRSYGYAVTFEELFEKLKLLNQKEIFKKRQELVNVCMKFCKILDSTDDNYGDLGIDAIIDEDLKIWIIEINKRQDHRIPLSIKDEQMYLATKNTPIKYAVGLSGFEL
ncbi:hypothetical protein GOM49_12955 [Clostridium bovifaecis]|uniref:YheC/YheD family protein n=1 Tax=Clostridium bovifaecis TaxID=2184719 RepID=A0A6I6F6A6_9CLOT|nr:hypothetical protein GOM49_12955 [Clostridium bovifaecis]